MRALVLATVVVAGLVVSGAEAPVTTIGVPGRSNEHLSVAALGQTVALSWAASSSAGTDVYASVSRDGGATFSTPARVNPRAGAASANGEQPPRVTLVARGTTALPEVVVVWTAKATAGTQLLAARSADGGRTFGASAVVTGSDAPGNRGWHSTTTDSRGRTFALWLDHRNLAGAASTMTHNHEAGASAPAPAPAPASKPDPVARAGQSQLYFAPLDGAGAARSLTGGVCYCCKTSLTTDASGGIYAVWRHVYAGNERDIALTVSRDGGRTFSSPVRVSRDAWQIDGCPENGPAVAVDQQKTVIVVWPTLVRDAGRESMSLFFATSRDGLNFSTRRALPTVGAAYHPQIALEPGGNVVATWEEVTAQGRRVVVARGSRDGNGQLAFRRLPAIDAQAGVYPTLAATPSSTVLAWVRRSEGGSMIAVTRLQR
ncbi:MAG: sialidase family protein [Vicinamibacterales bacterium]